MKTSLPLRASARPLARLAALALPLALLAVGCSILEPEPDVSRYFVLDSVNLSAASDELPKNADIHFGVGPVKLPGYLDTQGLVRTGSGTVEYIPNAFWAESMSTGFPRALLYRVGQRIGTTHAVAYPWYSTTRVDWKIPVDVLRFEALTDGRAVLVASWSVERTSDGRVVAGAQSTFEETGGADPALIVDAMSRCLDRLAGTIAKAVVDAAAQTPARRAPARK